MVNTWHFDHSVPVVITDFDNVRDMLKDFYQVVSGYQSTLAAVNQKVVKAYDLADPKPRQPVYTSTFTTTGSSNASPLPAEVALVTSFHAAPVSGQPAARRRNRKYLGAFATAHSYQGRPDPAMITAIKNAMVAMAQASNASTRWEWRCFSETNAEDYRIVGGWIDNAWDTQRRRGFQTTQRTTWAESAG